MWILYITPIIMLFLYLISLESLSKSVGILLVCILLTGGIILFAVYGSSQQLKKAELENIFEAETLDNVFRRIKDNFVEENESLQALNVLRKKAKTNSVKLIELEVVEFLLQILMTLNADDKRYIVAVDLLNQLLSCQLARKKLFSNTISLNSSVDNVVNICNTNFTIYQDQNHTNFMEKICNKLLMTMGLICCDCTTAQSRIGDKNAIQSILNFSFEKKSIHSSLLVKWGLWSLLQMTFNHPPNKFDFYHIGGINQVVNALQQHQDDPNIILQGLGLLLNTIIDDPHTKISLSQARQAVLNSGIVDLLQCIEIKYKNRQDIISMSHQLSSLIMNTWSY